jgi:hypothetical protein
MAPLASAARTDVLERDLAPVELSTTGSLELPLQPFELVTLKLASGSGTSSGTSRTSGSTSSGTTD